MSKHVSAQNRTGYVSLEPNPDRYTVSLNLGYSRIRKKMVNIAEDSLGLVFRVLHVSDRFSPFLFNFTEANIRMAP